jgi:type II secretory pathway pseudopilin PulG
MSPSRLGRALRGRLRSSIGAEDGFTIFEVLMAIVVLAVGTLAMVSTFDSSRSLTTSAEQRDVQAGIAERELERVTSLAYEKVALASTPGSSSDDSNPNYYVVSGGCAGSSGSPCYQWDYSSGGSSEPLAIDGTDGDSTPNPQSWTAPAPGGGTHLSGQIYRYVTSVDDPNCTSGSCPDGDDYKRVTVAVTMDKVQKKPYVVSSLVKDNVGGLNNPLTDSQTTCLDGGTWVPCAH